MTTRKEIEMEIKRIGALMEKERERLGVKNVYPKKEDMPEYMALRLQLLGLHLQWRRATN